MGTANLRPTQQESPAGIFEGGQRVFGWRATIHEATVFIERLHGHGFRPQLSASAFGPGVSAPAFRPRLSASNALGPDGILLSYLPTIRQVDRLVLRCLEAPGLDDPEVLEVLVRPWAADRERLRPYLKMTAHTGFLVRVRRVAEKPRRLPNARAAQEKM